MVSGHSQWAWQELCVHGVAEDRDCCKTTRQKRCGSWCNQAQDQNIMAKAMRQNTVAPGVAQTAPVAEYSPGI
eukprot:1146218-Pelagomonas_calceolata.AAC.9